MNTQSLPEQWRGALDLVSGTAPVGHGLNGILQDLREIAKGASGLRERLEEWYGEPERERTLLTWKVGKAIVYHDPLDTRPCYRWRTYPGLWNTEQEVALALLTGTSSPICRLPTNGWTES
jgi:hypothetical protein